MGGRALGAAFVLLVGSALAAPRAQHAFADVFPEDTALWVGVDELSAFGEGFAASPFGALLADPDFAPFMEELHRGLLGAEAQLGERWGVDLAGLRAEFRGAAAFGVCELVVEDPEAPGRSRLVMALLLELEAGAEARTLEAVDTLVEVLVDGAVQDLSMRFGDIDGTATTQITGFDLGATLSYTATDGALVFLGEGYAAQDDAGLERWVDALRARGEPVRRSLAEAPDFVDAGLGRAGAASRVRAFARLPALVLATSTRSPADVAARQALIDDWGLDACGPLVFEQSIDADGLRQDLRMAWGPDFSLGARLAQSFGAGEVRGLRWMPRAVRAAWAADLDPGAAFDALLELLGEFEPDAARALVLQLAELEADWGLHPRDDLIEAFDGQVAWFRLPFDADVDALVDDVLSTGERGDPTEFVRTWTFVLGLRDVDTVRDFVNARLRELALHVSQQVEEFEGYRVTRLPLPLVPGLSLTYAFTDDLLVLGFDAAQVRDVLRRRTHAELPSLADDPMVVAARAEVPSDAAVLQLTATAEELSTGMEIIQGLVRADFVEPGARPDGPSILWGDGEVRAVELLTRFAQLLPDPAVFARHLGRPNLAGYSVRAAGIEGRWILR